MRKDAEAAFLDRPRDALELYRRATALAPSHSALAWLRLARLHRQFKDPSSARAALRRGTRHLPKDARLWRALAQACKAAGDIEGAKARTAMMRECLRYFQDLWHQRKAKPEEGFDLITLMQRDPTTADMVDRPMDYLGNLGLLIVGGNDTTRNSITGGVLALNQNPAEYDKLRADHSLITSMVPEIIRWQTPLTHMRRTALEDVELGGKTIRKGDKVVMWYISGNRDETEIEHADDFIIDRANPRHHVSFGFGIHRCMGNRLAEMQLRVLWEEIMKRFRLVEVVGPEQRVHSNFVRGYTELPVVLRPR